MNLNYEKIKEKIEHGGNHWTSYSDLFLVLSVTFLLLFVVSNLRSGTMSIATQAQFKAAKAEAEDLRKQIKVYEQLRDDYVKQGATQDEVKVYQELMGRLSLLETEAGKDRKEFYAKAKQAQEKEQALNHYQELVKNIISANLVASARVKKRDNVIEAKQNVISEQERELSELNQTVADRESQIAKNNAQIQEIESELERRIKQVRVAYKSKHKSEKKLQDEISRIRGESEGKIGALLNANSTYVSQLKTAQEKLENQNRESERLLSQLKSKEEVHKNTLAELEKAHQEALAREQSAYQKGMAKAKSAEARLKQEQDYRASVEQQNRAYQDKLGALSGELEGTRKNIQNMQTKYQASIEGLKKSNNALQKNLMASNAKLNEQKVLAERISKNFKKAGIEADIDPKTGDVTIQFGEEYYESGSSDLKDGMRHILDKVVPVYAKSLFQDKKIAERISSVEVVGFASPTYQGKYVNPESLSLEDKNAVNYNMDLSYRRAKGIFEYIFDTNKMSFEHQKNLLPLVKVSGRSYLATERLAGKSNRTVGSVNDPKSYCSQFDCRKTQKVIVKFNLRDE